MTVKPLHQKPVSAPPHKHEVDDVLVLQRSGDSAHGGGQAVDRTRDSQILEPRTISSEVILIQTLSQIGEISNWSNILIYIRPIET